MAQKRELSIRLGVEGGAQVKNDFRDLGTAGKQAFDQIGKAGTAASENLDQLDKKLAATAGQARQSSTAVQQLINSTLSRQTGVAALPGSGPAGSAASSAAVFQYASAAQAAKAQAQLQAAQQASAALIASTLSQQHGVAVLGGSGSAGSAAASAAVFDEADKIAQRARALIEQHDLLTASERRYAESIETVNAALAQGSITSEQHQKVLAGEKAQLDSVRLAADRAAKGGFSLNAGSVSSLRAAGVNYFQGVAAGIDPLVLLQTEAAQVIGALVQGGEGITASMVAAGGAIAGVATAVGGLIYLYERGAGQADDFAKAQKVTANAAGITADSLDEIVKHATAVSDIGPASARAIATAMTATGKLSADVIAKLTASVADYAEATGQSAVSAGAKLAQSFADPEKALHDLDGAYNLLSISERKRISDLIEQGDKVQAQIELADKLNARLKNLATDGVGVLGETFHDLARYINEAADAVANFGRGQTLDEQISATQAKIDQLLQAREQQRNAPLGQFLPFNGQNELTDLFNDMAILNARKAADEQKAAADKAAADLRNLGKEADDAAQKYGGFTEKQRQLTNEIQKWSKAVGDLRAGGDTVGADTAANVLAAKQAELSNLLTPLQESQRQLSHAQATAGLPAYLRGAQQAYQTTLDQDSRSTDPVVRAQAEAHAQAEKTRVLLEQTQAIRDQNAQMQVNHDLALGVADAWSKGLAAGQEADATRQAALDHLQSGIDATTRKMQILREANDNALISASKTLADLRQQNTGAELTADAAFQGRDAEHQAQLMQQIADRTKEARAALETATDPTQAQVLRDVISSIADETIRWDEATQRQALGEAVQGQQDQVDLLQKQIDLIGVGNDQRDIELAKAQALIDLSRMHIDIMSDEGRAYADNAVEIAKLGDELKRQQAIADELPNFIDQSFDRIGSAITQFSVEGGNAFKQLGNIGLAILSELEQEVFKLAVINPLKNWINGDNALPNLGDVIGKGLDFLSGLGGSGGYQGTGAPSPALPRADGGLIVGPGGPRSDNIHVMASPGEFYVNAASTAKHLPLLQAINADRLPHFADGGFVGPDSSRNAETPSPVAWMDKNRAGANDNKPAVQVNVNNYGDQEVTTSTRQGPNNQQIIDLFINAAAKDVTRGGKLGQAMGMKYGLNPVAGMKRA